MKNSLLKIVKWFCRQLTFNELASAVIIFHEVLSNARSDIALKLPEKPPHYREFHVDTIPPLLSSKLDTKEKNLDWCELQKNMNMIPAKKSPRSNEGVEKHLISDADALFAMHHENFFIRTTANYRPKYYAKSVIIQARLIMQKEKRRLNTFVLIARVTANRGKTLRFLI